MYPHPPPGFEGILSERLKCRSLLTIQPQIPLLLTATATAFEELEEKDLHQTPGRPPFPSMEATTSPALQPLRVFVVGMTNAVTPEMALAEVVLVHGAGAGHALAAEAMAAAGAAGAAAFHSC